MKGSEDQLKHNPFEALKPLLKSKKKAYRAKDIPPPAGEPIKKEKEEEDIFREAMENVKPISRNKYVKAPKIKHKARLPKKEDSDKSAVAELENLVKYGEGFVVSKTPEYMEGTGQDIPPEFAERLHRGDFSIQDHIDLHGMSVAQAKDAFESFLNNALMTDKRAVLIIHGRGLSSPGEPVLKNKVSDWLTRSHWRKWIIAFTSAQSYDGGTGATYVLLRRRPAPFKRKPRKHGAG